MRVLLLNYEYPPLGGGAGVATAELARRLSSGGATVHVVTSSERSLARRRRASTRPPGNPDAAQPELTIHRVRSLRKGIHEAGYLGAAGYVVSALPLVRRLVRISHYDVVHFFFSLPTGAMLPFLRLDGTRVIVSLRGSDVPGYDRDKRSLRAAHFLAAPLTKSIWRRADHVVAVCSALAQLAKNAHPGLPISVIRNGVDLQLFHPSTTRRSTGSGPINCIAVARLVGRKGIDDLLRGWQRLERGRLSLAVVGDGPKGAELRKLAADLSLGGDVRFLGPMPQSRLAEQYRRADLFTLVPRAEAFGNAFAEAMASGLPIVGSDVGGIAELVRNGENGLLVPPQDPAALAAAIERLARDDTLRLRMGSRGRADAEQQLSWQRMTDKYVELYRELVDSAGRRDLT